MITFYAKTKKWKTIKKVHKIEISKDKIIVNWDTEVEDIRQVFTSEEMKWTRTQIPPRLERVKSYCVMRKNSIDPEVFIDHYESNGRKVGKNKMKNRQAAIRTRERSWFNREQTKTEKKTSSRDNDKIKERLSA